MRLDLVLAFVGVILPVVSQSPARPDLTGEWSLVSATTNKSRTGVPGEVPIKTYVATGSAFNCGRGCRIVHQGANLTVENAELEDGASAPSLPVTLVLDGKSHDVVDSVTPGRKIQTVGRWEDVKLLITSTILGRPLTQTIVLERNQLVVLKPSISGDATLTYRYSKK